MKAARSGQARGTAYNLVKLLEAQVMASDSTLDQVGEQRERNHRYYTMQPLGNEQRGRSHYVSPDVLDSVSVWRLASRPEAPNFGNRPAHSSSIAWSTPH